jgi:SPP1 family predicted phage head-tail adaptor
MSYASLLSERVTIQQPVQADDGYGGKLVTWGELATVFAQVEPIFVTQGEHLAAEQVTAYAGYRVTVRMRTDVTAAMRVVWKTHMLQIHSLHEQGEVLSILAYEESL